MDYVGFVAWCFIVALGGGFVGLVLGNLRLPVVLVLASSPAAAAGANVGISAIAAATASVAHVRAGRINWKLFGWMAPPTVVGALAGGYVSGVVPGDLLLLAIAAVLYYSAAELLGWSPLPVRGRAAGGDSRLNITAAIVVAFVIGVLGGFVGLILGSLRLPALLRVVGETPARAIGTNITVGFCLGVAGVVGHLLSEAPDWTLLALGGAASIPGAALGARLTGRLSEPQLVKAIALVLLVAATAMVVEALA
jgi:uncharacterized membrane protein YfcA